MKTIKLGKRPVTFNGKPKEVLVNDEKEIILKDSKNPIESLKAISKDTIKIRWSNGLSDDTTLKNAKELSKTHGVKIDYPKAIEVRR